MQKVKGVGGVFFKPPQRREELLAWYRDQLGIDVDAAWGGVVFPQNPGGLTWSIFAPDTQYFGPTASFMVNYVVDDLAAMLAQLRANGQRVDDAVLDNEYGKFGWVYDPQGNRVELWQAP